MQPSLPPEVLGKITGYLNIIELRNLFLTCNHELQDDLIVGTDRFVLNSTIGPKDPLPIRSWPHTFLKQFKNIITINIGFECQDLLLPPFTISISNLASLPPMLSTLSLDLEDCVYNSSVKQLPQTLTSLYLPNNEYLTDKGIVDMPVGLIRLWIPRARITHQSFGVLPPQLVILNIDNCREITFHSLDLLTQSLTELHLCQAVLNDENDLKNLKFPPKLKYLNVESLVVPLARLLPLPDQLVYLNISSVIIPAEATDIQDIDLWPSSLTNLEIFNATQFWPNFFQSLPDGLFSLDIRHCDTRKEELFLAKIPRTLQSLNLHDFENFRPLDILDLPTRLTSLNIAWAQSLRDSNITSLPRSLTLLNIARNEQLTDECVPNLPPLLTHLNMNGTSHLTDKMVPSLPRKLTYLSLDRSKQLSNDCVKNFPSGLIFLNLFANTRIEPHLLRTSLVHLKICSLNFKHKL